MLERDGKLKQLYKKLRVSRRLHFEDTKRIMSPEMRPKSFGTFEKRAPDPVYIILFKCPTQSRG